MWAAHAAWDLPTAVMLAYRLETQLEAEFGPTDPTTVLVLSARARLTLLQRTLAVSVGAVVFGAATSYADGGGTAENMFNFNSGVVNFTSQQTPNGAPTQGQSSSIQSPLGTFDLTKNPLGNLAGLNVGPR
ncbi:hypothetical protein EDD91_7489 [Streptomyces sp. KS 21]|nr:hypothetical protein EDD91_7489 [Streptomyces sp. KS 21]